MKREFKAVFEPLETPIGVLRLSGSVDSASSEALNDALDQALDGGRDHLVLEMSDLLSMSTAGWSVLVGKLRRLRVRKGALHLCGLSLELNEVYQLLEFDKLLPAHPTLEDALGAVRAGATT